MKKMGLAVMMVLSGVMLASCAFRSSSHSFGPYSDAENFYKKGNYPKAIAKYQEYLAANPQGNLAAIAEYYTAKSYVASGDTAQARDRFEQVKQKFPGTSWAAFAKEQLEMMQGEAKV